MDSIDYYDRYAVPYYEETVELSMEEQLQRFMDQVHSKPCLKQPPHLRHVLLPYVYSRRKL